MSFIQFETLYLAGHTRALDGGEDPYGMQLIEIQFICVCDTLQWRQYNNQIRYSHVRALFDFDTYTYYIACGL